MKQFLQRYARFILFGALLFFSVVTFANPTITPITPSQSPSNVVSVSGKVVDECGLPVENALVSADVNFVFTDSNGE